MRMPIATVQLMASMARLEGRQLAISDNATQVSLEALRLGDPAAMSGCWNPGCASVLSLAWCRITHDLSQRLRLRYSNQVLIQSCMGCRCSALQEVSESHLKLLLCGGCEVAR